MEELKATYARPSSTAETAVALAEDLKAAPKEPTVKTELAKLFGKSQSDKSFSFNVSAVATQPQKKKKRSTLDAVRKPVTAVCLEKKPTSIPRKGARERLANEGRIKCIEVTGAMSSKEVEGALKTAFPCFQKEQTISFFKATGANNLSESTMPETWTGRDILTLVGQGCLYFLPTTVQDCQENTTADCDAHAPPIPASSGQAKPMFHSPVDGLQAKPSAGLWNTDLLKQQMFDPWIGSLWLEEAGLSTQDETPPAEVNNTNYFFSL